MPKEVAIEPVWSHPVERTARPPERIVVTGVRKGAIFTPTAVAIPDPVDVEAAGTPAPFPLGENLAPLLESRTFGVEERVSVERDGEGWAIRCGAGSRPAGAAFFSDGFRYPRAMRGELVVEGRTGSDFSFAVVAKGADSPKRPAYRASGPTLASIPSSEWGGGDATRELVVSCSEGAGTMTISAVRIVPRPRTVSAAVGTWIWDIAPWLEQPERLLLLLRGEDAEDVFVQIRIDDGEVADGDRLRRLIEMLSAAGTEVHAVEGDPDMATAAGRAHALERAQVLRRFMEASRLRSIQYDIEPYLRPDHAADAAASWHAWAVTVRQLAEALGGKVEVVVPFWMLDRPAGMQALKAVEGAISAVTVMAYRTDPAEIERIAEGWLSWAATRDVAIGIAVENGPLPTEVHRTFVRAERGEVAIDRSGERHSVLVFSDPVSDSYTKPVYSFSHEVEVPPSRISFLGDQEALARARDRLARTLSAWAAFRGLLVHELINMGTDPSRGRQREQASECYESKGPDLR